VLLRLFETARRFDMQVQPQLILLQKTLFNIEGLGRQLYPELDLWKTAQPVLREWMRERTSPRTILREIRARIPDALLTLQQVPRILQTAVNESAEASLRSVNRAEAARLRAEMRAAALRRDLSIATGVLWLSGVLTLQAANFRWLGWLQMAAAVLLFLRLWTLRPRKE
jgi:ubiquinone biosynthesis protein